MENYENDYAAPETEEAVEISVVEETPVAEESSYGQDFANNQAERMSIEEFMRNNEELNKTVKTIAIISYVILGFNALGILFDFFVLIDVAILLVCTLSVHKKKDKGYAVAILLYGTFSCLLGLVLTGRLTGWLWIVIGAVYLVAFNKAEKEYKAIYGV